ncbi:BZ3500_MvSof-1268-A1-R1_Chr1-3g01944 [Microbotryum saponariae]|uniref:Protein-serine/threonine kinase n=1 Tax=Microbotryum saponariae TaxID=289078 RepID=A0A2X0KRW7_9BASI|nr:BZ3500_MvSof-1268-A1-R1_Chr1-3g01944 [Microbotryum saponariae]SCZ94968.1 BZ3501_MvSof-1269-A2-R1_Chr1-3g01546 [Microbotryum saponariae]
MLSTCSPLQALELGCSASTARNHDRDGHPCTHQLDPSILLQQGRSTSSTIEKFAAQRSTPISLKHLINFGKHGRNKGEQEEGEKLLKSGNFLRTELPTRLSHRLRDLQELPYVVASNPRIEHVYQLYLEAFEAIRRFPVIKTLEDNNKFCAFMQSTLNRHRVVIPDLAIGICETSPHHLGPREVDRIMTRMLRSRLSRRVITEQHIGLTHQLRDRQRTGKHAIDLDRYVGVVDTRIRLIDVVKRCTELIKGRGGPEALVEIKVEGKGVEDEFAYIPEHLEFMLFELLKSAAHSTIVNLGAEAASSHPITITISHQPRDVSIRISDQAGGIPPYGGLPPTEQDILLRSYSTSPDVVIPVANSQRLDLFTFAHMRRFYQHHLLADEQQGSTREVEEGRKKKPVEGIEALRAVGQLEGTVAEQVKRHRARASSQSQEEDGKEAEENDEEMMQDAQMKSGIGLPLARMFAEYFSGSLEIFTVQGYGSDAWLKIPKFGNAS